MFFVFFLLDARRIFWDEASGDLSLFAAPHTFLRECSGRHIDSMLSAERQLCFLCYILIAILPRAITALWDRSEMKMDFYSAALFLHSKPIIMLDKVLNKQATFKLISMPYAAAPAAAVTPPPHPPIPPLKI